MKLSILFWFYKEVSVCKNHLRLLRHYNPDIRIYGLYGGLEEEFPVFEHELSPFLDDLSHVAFDKDAHWKWVNGDLMINEWFRNCGQHLEWETLIIVQWDMLITGNVSDIFSELGENQILLSGLRPVVEVAPHWYWVRREQPRNHERFNAFKEHLHTHYDFDGPVLACHFVVACLPRSFLEKYSMIEQPELGMVEYRVPTYAKLFEIPFCTSKQFESWWQRIPDATNMPWIKRVLAPTGSIQSQPLIRIIYHLLHRSGSRIFHPFIYVFPQKPTDIILFLFNKQRLSNLKRTFKRFLGKRNLHP